jgi:cysteine desulfuration protein SufE
MTIEEKTKDIENNIALLEDWEDRYTYLLVVAGRHRGSAEVRRPENLLRGCQSRTWIELKWQNGALRLCFDSESVTVRGLIGLLAEALDGHTAKEIENADLSFITKPELYGHISAARAGGIRGAVDKIKSECREAAGKCGSV